MGLNTSQCVDVNNLAGTERYSGANIGGGESHSKFHFTPFQEDKDGMFMWAHNVFHGGGCGTPDGVDRVLVPLGCGVQVQSSDKGVDVRGIGASQGRSLFGKEE